MMESDSDKEEPEQVAPFQQVHIKSEPLDDEYFSEQQTEPESNNLEVKKESKEITQSEMDSLQKEHSEEDKEEEVSENPLDSMANMVMKEKELEEISLKQCADQNSSRPKRKKKQKSDKSNTPSTSKPSSKRKSKKLKDVIKEEADDPSGELFPLQLVSVQMENSDIEELDDIPANLLYPDVDINEEPYEGIASHTVLPKHVQIPGSTPRKPRIRKKAAKKPGAASKPPRKRKPNTEKTTKKETKILKPPIGKQIGPIPKYQCFFCTDKFEIKDEIFKHIAIKHPEKKLKCEHCDYKDWFKYSLLHHITSVHFPKKNKPPVNTSISKTLGFIIPSLTKAGTSVVHKVVAMNKVPMKIFMCIECQRTFRSQAEMTYHHKSKHLNIRDHGCTICPKRFVTSNNLKQHYENAHSDLRPYHCTKCPAQFKTKSNLNKHYIMHEDVYQFQCNICERNFKRKSCLNSHVIQVHSQIRNFECEICSKKFKTKCKLTAHKVVHSDICPFQCEQCGSRFKRKHALDVHIKMVHKKK